MEWYPSLFLKFFHQLIFPCRHTCFLETLGTIPTSLLVFVENVFTSLSYVDYVGMVVVVCIGCGGGGCLYTVIQRKSSATPEQM